MINSQLKVLNKKHIFLQNKHRQDEFIQDKCFVVSVTSSSVDRVRIDKLANIFVVSSEPFVWLESVTQPQ